METDGSGYVRGDAGRLSTNILCQIWEYFLAYSTIISRQGSASCFQITLVKNINSTHRVEGIPSQFGLLGAMAASKVDAVANKARNLAGGLGEKVKDALRSNE